MTTHTTRSSSPAAPTRFARGGAALPHDTALDDLLADKRIGSTAKNIALALVKNWAWYKNSCFPSDRTIAAKVGRSPGHVQRCLRQLEDAGLIFREKTNEVPSGRRIWLLWRCLDGGQGAQPPTASARSLGTAPARDKQVVVELQEDEQKIQQTSSRQRPEPPSAPANPLALVLDQVMKSVKTVPETDSAPGAGPHPALPSAPLPRCQEPLSGAREVTPIEVALDLRLRSEGPRLPALVTPPTPTAATDVRLSVLTAAEQARFWLRPEAVKKTILTWLGLGDGICLGEARKLLGPPAAAEPPPSSLVTSEMLAGLPGRPDRVVTVASRLCEELKDAKSFNYYQSVARTVSVRRHPASALISAWRQGTNPQSTRPGAVFAYAWKRETSSG